MFTMNKNGKISCIVGIPAFVLSGLAAYSGQFRMTDRDNPLLSPFVNIILRPSAKLLVNNDFGISGLIITLGIIPVIRENLNGFCDKP